MTTSSGSNEPSSTDDLSDEEFDRLLDASLETLSYKVELWASLIIIVAIAAAINFAAFRALRYFAVPLAGRLFTAVLMIGVLWAVPRVWMRFAAPWIAQRALHRQFDRTR